jgi:hypothetical protein
MIELAVALASAAGRAQPARLTNHKERLGGRLERFQFVRSTAGVGLRQMGRPEGERRLVDLTGLEPVTS